MGASRNNGNQIFSQINVLLHFTLIHLENKFLIGAKKLLVTLIVFQAKGDLSFQDKEIIELAKVCGTLPPSTGKGWRVLVRWGGGDLARSQSKSRPLELRDVEDLVDALSVKEATFGTKVRIEVKTPGLRTEAYNDLWQNRRGALKLHGLTAEIMTQHADFRWFYRQDVCDGIFVCCILLLTVRIKSARL